MEEGRQCETPTPQPARSGARDVDPLTRAGGSAMRQSEITRWAWLGRTSTDDLQDPTLSLPRQLGNSTVALPPGGMIVAYFYDVESGRSPWVRQRSRAVRHPYPARWRHPGSARGSEPAQPPIRRRHLRIHRPSSTTHLLRHQDRTRARTGRRTARRCRRAHARRTQASHRDPDAPRQARRRTPWKRWKSPGTASKNTPNRASISADRRTATRPRRSLTRSPPSESRARPRPA